MEDLQDPRFRTMKVKRPVIGMSCAMDHEFPINLAHIHGYCTQACIELSASFGRENSEDVEPRFCGPT